MPIIHNTNRSLYCYNGGNEHVPEMLSRIILVGIILVGDWGTYQPAYLPICLPAYLRTCLPAYLLVCQPKENDISVFKRSKYGLREIKTVHIPKVLAPRSTGSGHCQRFGVQPISVQYVLRFWISEGLTQAESSSQGVELSCP